jgi:hypothetical protein
MLDEGGSVVAEYGRHRRDGPLRGMIVLPKTPNPNFPTLSQVTAGHKPNAQRYFFGLDNKQTTTSASTPQITHKGPSKTST